MLHISADEQRERLLARLDDPTKYWKFKPGDVDERRTGRDYRAAYEIALERCNTEAAPWYVVPSDRKWYRNLGHRPDCSATPSRAMELRVARADFDVEEQRRRLGA